MKLFKHSPRYTDALGDTCFPKDNLPKLLDGLGLPSREVFQAETSRVSGGAGTAGKVRLDEPQPAQLDFFIRKVLGLCSLSFLEAFELAFSQCVLEQFLASHFL